MPNETLEANLGEIFVGGFHWKKRDVLVSNNTKNKNCIVGHGLSLISLVSLLLYGFFVQCNRPSSLTVTYRPSSVSLSLSPPQLQQKSMHKQHMDKLKDMSLHPEKYKEERRAKEKAKDEGR